MTERDIKEQPPRLRHFTYRSRRRADRERTINSWLLWILFCLVLLACFGCRVTEYVPVTQIRHTTTTVHDTVVEVVTQGERVEVVVPAADTTSVLFTKYATSTAKVRGGLLYHALWQPVRVDSVSVQYVTQHVSDSIPYPVEVEVVREVVPTWCWWMLAVAGIAIAAIAMIMIKRLVIS